MPPPPWHPRVIPGPVCAAAPFRELTPASRSRIERMARRRHRINGHGPGKDAGFRPRIAPRDSLTRRPVWHGATGVYFRRSRRTHVAGTGIGNGLRGRPASCTVAPTGDHWRGYCSHRRRFSGFGRGFMDIAELLAFSVKNKASDLHLSSGLPPMIRVDGDIRRINLPALEHKQVHALVYDIMSDKQRRDYEEFLEVDFSFEIPGLARFRVNAFNQNRGAGAVFRTIPAEV